MSYKEACLEFARTLNRQTLEVALAAEVYNDREAFTEAFRNMLDLWQAEISNFKKSIPSTAFTVDKATVLKETSNLNDACVAVMNNPDKHNIAQLGQQAVCVGLACDKFLG
ncbi:MAG: hypothetical protein IJF90_04815 [Synergistaceae bacterium]|nr:hypothetical protein [Synergistaceae bacterium]MBQ2675333.1 hypothetical protein [Prevotella sp.]MBQ6148891.1 hypothetical protein [Oscillospiraceae bacterium]